MWEGGSPFRTSKLRAFFELSARKLRELEPRLLLKKKGVIGSSAGLAFVLLTFLALGPIARSRADDVGRRYGVRVEIGHVWPAWGGLRLTDVKVHALDAGWLAGELARVDVGLGITFGPRRIHVRGGRVAMSGSVDEITERLRSMTKRPASGAPPREGGGPTILVEGAALRWEGPFGAGSVVEVEDARVSREPSEHGGTQGLVAARGLRVERAGAKAKGRDLLARFGRDGEATRWQEARLEGLDLELHVGAGGVDAGGAGAPGPTGGALAAVGSAGAGRGYVGAAIRLRDELTRVAAAAAEQFTAGAPVTVNGLGVVIVHGDQRLNIGPGRLNVQHRPNLLEIDFSPGQSDAQAADPYRLSVHAAIPTAPGEIAFDVRGGPVTLAALGVHERDFGLLDVDKAKLEAKGSVKLSADGARLLVDGDGRVTSLSVVHKALSDEPARGIDLGLRASGVAELDGSLLRVDEGKIELGSIRLEAYGAIVQESDFVRIEGRANVPVSDCQKMFESLPQAFVPRLKGMTMRGSFALRSGFRLDTRRPDDIVIDWDLKNHCRVIKAPAEIDVARFGRPFRRTVYDEHGEKVEIVSGPGTPDWVPLHVISPFMEAAVTTTEDGGFRRHGGFDKTAIKNSIRDNLRAKRFLRGASTITMQLAKNLYLEREKNLSRKLQEAILTTYLEQALTKDEILELYFNLVEFGPMIYGIGPAADHYFDTSANDLSLGQSLFLTSILPNPKRTYFAPTGQVTKGWLGYLHRLMKIMRNRNKINDQELMDGVSEVITYHVARSPRVRPPNDVIQRELGSDFIPWITPEGP